MSFANDSALAGDGSTIALQLISSLKHQTSIVVDNGGHLVASRAQWFAFFNNNGQNGAGLEVGELFNAQANLVRVRGLWIIPTMTPISGSQIGYDVRRISTVGTGGTSITPRPLDPGSPALSGSITARWGASAGATLQYLYFSQYNWNEETVMPIGMLPVFNLLPVIGDKVCEIVLPNGSGLQIRISVSGSGITQAMMHFVVDN